MSDRMFQWQDDRERLAQLDDEVARRRTARFGTEEMDASAKAERVRRHFASVAARYDLMNTVLSMGIQYYWKYVGMRRVSPQPGEWVLDVCGGTGDLSVAAMKAVGDGGRVVCYDINHDMMAAGRSKILNRRWRRRVEWVRGDAEEIGFADASFDVVTIGFAVRNITHMKRAFREMHRVLKPGGRFLCLEFSRPAWPWFRRIYDLYSFHVMPVLGAMFAGERTAYLRLPETIRLFLTPEELADVLREVGFREVRHELLTNGIAVLHGGVK